MSGRTAKAARKAEDAKIKDFEARHDAFMKGVKELALKHKVDLVATLQYGQTGLVPRISVVDISEKFGNVTPEMQTLMEEQAKENASKRDDILKN